MKVHLRGAWNEYFNHDLSSYFCTHSDYVSPAHVLGRDHVTVQFVTPTKQVVFCVTQEEEDIYDMKVPPTSVDFASQTTEKC